MSRKRHRQRHQNLSYYAPVSRSSFLDFQSGPVYSSCRFLETRKTYRAVLSEPRLVILPSTNDIAATNADVVDGDVMSMGNDDSVANLMREPLAGGPTTVVLADLPSTSTSGHPSVPDPHGQTKRSRDPEGDADEPFDGTLDSKSARRKKRKQNKKIHSG